MKIIDNFLTKTYHNHILDLLTSLDFEWQYGANITEPQSRSKEEHFNEYGFSHCFWDGSKKEQNGRYTPFIQPMLYQIMDFANCDFIIRARADMVTWTGKENFIHPAHIDFDIPNTASIFYVNETDGDTIFYNIKPNDVPNGEADELEKVSPKANRLVLFDGDLLHTGCSPRKHKNRILINSNYMKKEYAEEFQNFLKSTEND